MIARSAALPLALFLSCATSTPTSTAKSKPTPTPTPSPTPASTSVPETPDAPFRAEKPPPLAGQPRFEAPVPLQRKLRNGARVLVAENHAVPIVAIEILFGTGIGGESPGKSGLAGFVASMVTESTRSRSTTQLAAELEDEAIELGAGAGNETSRIRLNTLKEALPKAIELLADVLQNPAFRPADVDRIRRLKLAALAQKQGSPGALAADRAAALLYGEKHPWGQPAGGTPETVGSITPDDLRKFQRTWYRPNNAIVSVAGDVTADEIVNVLDRRLAGWKKAPLPQLRLPPFPPLEDRFISALDKPGTTQSQVWVVGRTFDARNPDRQPLLVANEVLGGLFTSRLNMNLREQHGYSYGIASSVSLNKTYGTFFVTGGILAQHTAEAVREYEREMTKFAAEGPTDEEVAKAKETIIRGLPAALETDDAVSAALATLDFDGMPLDYYRTVADRYAKITRADAARAAKQWIQPGRWPVIVVGPVGGAVDPLRALALGEVRVQPAPGSGEVVAGPQQAPPGAKGPTAGSAPVPEAVTGSAGTTSPAPPAGQGAAAPVEQPPPGAGGPPAAPGSAPSPSGTPPAPPPAAQQPPPQPPR